MRPIHIFLLFSIVALFAGLYKVFEKAGEKGWKALIPVYNFYIWLRIIQKPWWWLILILIPTVGFYMLAIMLVLLSNCFGKRKPSNHIFSIVGYFLWVPYLGFSKNVKFTGVPKEPQKKNIIREWGEAGVFAVIAATLIRTFFFEAFVIPSSSMEGSLLVGDYLFVSKLSYGAKIPAVPLTIPFTHNTLPFTETTRSYLDWIILPEIRLPALEKIQRNDIVVFNFPEGDSVYRPNRNMSYYQYVRDSALSGGIPEAQVRRYLVDNDLIVTHPVDKEDNYVKRCVAISGDRLEVKDRKLYINGQLSPMPKEARYAWNFNYRMNSREDYENFLDRLHGIGITDNFGRVSPPTFDTLHSFTVPVPPESIDAFKSLVGNDACIALAPKGATDVDIFPHYPKQFPWNRDNFGPIVIPKKGMTVHLTVDSLPLWRRAISVYEGNSLEVKDGKIFINGKQTDTYTFKQNYFFMMGDNRDNSLDSRYWGYVPADHIIGKPVFIWLSKGDYSGLRPNRMMCFVTKDGLSRSYLWWVISGIVILAGLSYYREKGKAKNSAAGSKKK